MGNDVDLTIAKILQGDALEQLKTLDSNSVDMCMTSPPYWALRDYGVAGQLGLEPTFDEYIHNLCDVFDEVKRVLKKEGTCWVNIGDTYWGSGSGTQYEPNVGNSKEVYVMPYKSAKIKQRRADSPYQPKCLTLVPLRFAIEMVNRGWILRNTIIWYKPNAMPSSAKDRFTVDFEYIFFFSKNKKYYFEQQFDEAVSGTDMGILRSKKQAELNTPSIKKRQEAGIDSKTAGTGQKNKRTVWEIPTKPFTEAHFAVYPEELCETPIRAGCPKGGVVLDPFFGAGTTGVVAIRQGKGFIGIELSDDYIKIAEKRLRGVQPELI